ncbi:retrograde regulation protein 2 [Xylariaceae sp. FL1651]|nr:retrograde regulation protein 2 [Xylariaceae sp. FL1651]
MSDIMNTSSINAEHMDKPQQLLLNELPPPDELSHLSEDELITLETTLTRRLDFTMMPVVFLLFLLNILDRNNIASAKLVGIQQDLGMTNNHHFLLLIPCQVITQVPSNLVIGKGLVSMSQGFVTNFSGLASMRFLLGLAEAPFLPSVFIVMSSWYKRTELPLHIAILYGGNMLATAFFGLIAADITNRLDNVAGKYSWQWLFIIEGLATVVLAILLLPLMTDYLLQSKHLFLPLDVQLMAERRIRNENAGIVDEDPESIFWGLKQALIDPKLYMFTILQMALITTQSFNNFFPSIDTTTLLLTAPPYFFAFFVSLAVSFHAARRHERGYHIAVPMVFGVVGNLLAMFANGTGPRYFSLFLLTAGTYSPYNLCVSWVSSSLPRPRAKRTAALATFIFPDWQKPRYHIGGAIMTGACVVKQNAMFEAEEAQGVIAHDQITASRSGGDAIVAFRFVH